MLSQAICQKHIKAASPNPSLLTEPGYKTASANVWLLIQKQGIIAKLFIEYTLNVLCPEEQDSRQPDRIVLNTWDKADVWKCFNIIVAESSSVFSRVYVADEENVVILAVKKPVCVQGDLQITYFSNADSVCLDTITGDC